MQGALTTIENVVKWVEMNNTPHWRIFSDTIESRNSYPLMSCMKEPDMTASIKILRDTLGMYNTKYGGVFNILLSKDGNPKDNSGTRSNIALGMAENTEGGKMHGIGSISPEYIEARIQKAVNAKETELRKEYEHKAAIQGLKDEMEAIREDRKNEWSFERINGIVDTLLQNPILQAVVMKATGLGAIPTVQSVGENRTDDSHAGTDNDDKIDLAAETLESAGYQNSGDILLGIAKFIKENPSRAMDMFNSIQNQQA